MGRGSGSARIGGIANRDRGRVRSLQDQIIRRAERLGIADDVRLSRDLPADITLGNLRRVIFPKYEGELRDVLAGLRRR